MKLCSKTFTLTPIITLVLVVILLSGCHPFQTPSPEPTRSPSPVAEHSKVNQYLPLKVGNSWNYEGIGNEYASYSQKVTHQQDNHCQVIVNSGTSTVIRYQITEDSILQTYRDHEFYEDKSILDLPSNIEIIVLKQPLKVGATWQSDDNLCEIVSVNDTVQVPAGSFKDCLAVKTTYKDSGNYSIDYYAKEVGLVKSEYVMDNNEKVISQLSDYSCD